MIENVAINVAYSMELKYFVAHINSLFNLSQKLKHQY